MRIGAESHGIHISKMLRAWRPLPRRAHSRAICREKLHEHRPGGDKGSLPGPSDSVGSTVVSFDVLWASVVLSGLAVRYPVRILSSVTLLSLLIPCPT